MAHSEASSQFSAIEITLKEQISKPLSSKLLVYLGQFLFPFDTHLVPVFCLRQKSVLN